MPDNPNKQGNEKIRNKEGNNQEYQPINYPIANCEIKIKRTVDLPENNTLAEMLAWSTSFLG
jgi:hypothetical protein